MIFDIINGNFRGEDLAFSLELFVAELLFLSVLKKKNKYPLKLSLAVAIYLLAIFLIPPYLNYERLFKEALFIDLFYAAVYSLFLIFLATAVNLPIYDTKKRNVVFCCIAGYCVQHICFNIWETLALFVHIPRLNAFRYLVYAVIYALFYVFLARKMRIGENVDMENMSVLVISIAVITVIIFIKFLSRYETGTSSNEFSGNMYSVTCSVLILFIQFSLYRRKEMQRQVDVIEYMWKKDKEHYRFNKEYIDSVNIKAHDLKFAVGELKRKYSDEFIHSAEEALNGLASFFHTGNDVLDVVLSEKGIYCSARNIRLTCLADGSVLNFINESDLYFCLSNALENAISAVEAVKEEDKRLVSLSLRKEKGFAFLHIENYYEGKLSLKKGRLESTKSDKKNHGYGLKSIEMITKKYGGSISYTANDQIFSLDLSFSIK